MKRFIQPSPKLFSWRIAGALILIALGFLFLFFLLWRVCYSSAAVESSLREMAEKIKAASASVDQVAVEVTIHLAADGTISLQGKGAVSDLAAELQRLVLATQGHKLLIVLSCDEDASYARVTEMLDTFGKAGIKNLTFTVGGEEF